MERSGGQKVTLNQHNSASAISYPGDIDLMDGHVSAAIVSGMLRRHQI